MPAYMDRRIAGDEIEEALEDFCEQKQGDTGEKLWLTLGAGSDSRLHAVVKGGEDGALQKALASFVPGTQPKDSTGFANPHSEGDPQRKTKRL